MLNWFINLPRVAVCGRCCVNIKALPFFGEVCGIKDELINSLTQEEQYKLCNNIVFWNSARSSSQCAVNAQIFLNTAVYKAQCPRRPWSFVYYQGRLINSVFCSLQETRRCILLSWWGTKVSHIYLNESTQFILVSVCLWIHNNSTLCFFVCFVFCFT